MRLLKRRMKWYCSVFPFGSFGVFVKLPDRWAETVCRGCLCVSVCVCGCAQGGKGKKAGRKKRKRKSLWKCQMQKRLRVISSLCLCQRTALITSPPQLRAGSWAKPTWTRLNQAWTYSAQHALCFKPWLIGPEASQTPFPAVTAIGLRKERDGGRGKEHAEEIHLHEFPLDRYHLRCSRVWNSLLFFWLAQPGWSWTSRFGSKCGESTDREAIWPSEWGDGEKRLHLLWQRALSLSVCQFKESRRMSQVHLAALWAAGAPLA